MSASLQLLGIIIYFLIQSVCVFSSPGPGLLNYRQSSCDSLVCPPSLDDFVEGSGDLWNGVLDVGAGVAGWVIDKATGLLIPQPAESESEKNQNNANSPVADPSDLRGSLDTPQDQCTTSSNSSPNDESGQVSHHVRMTCCIFYNHMLIPGLVIVGIFQRKILWVSHTAARVGVGLQKWRRKFSFGSHLEEHGQ